VISIPKKHSNRSDPDGFEWVIFAQPCQMTLKFLLSPKLLLFVFDGLDFVEKSKDFMFLAASAAQHCQNLYSVAS
jgi:hypothetical protein